MEEDAGNCDAFFYVTAILEERGSVRCPAIGAGSIGSSVNRLIKEKSYGFQARSQLGDCITEPVEAGSFRRPQRRLPSELPGQLALRVRHRE